MEGNLEHLRDAKEGEEVTLSEGVVVRKGGHTHRVRKGTTLKVVAIKSDAIILTNKAGKVRYWIRP